MISFYGKTGSGKSTSINYFRGYPLKTSKNDYGITIVDIGKKIRTELDSPEEEEVCKIGHSNIFSETIFSRGYKTFYEEQKDKEGNK